MTTLTTPPIAEPAPAYTPVHHPQPDIELGLLPPYSPIPPVVPPQQPPAPKSYPPPPSPLVPVLTAAESRPAGKKRSPTSAGCSTCCDCLCILFVANVSIVCVVLIFWGVAKSTHDANNSAAMKAEAEGQEKEKREQIGQTVLGIAGWTEVNGVAPGEEEEGVSGMGEKLGGDVIGF